MGRERSRESVMGTRLDVFIAPIFHAYYAQYPFVVVDAGARGGAHPRWARLRPHVRLIGFDLDGTTGEGEMLRLGLYRERGTLDFYVTARPDGASLFRPNMEWLERLGGAERFQVQKVIRVLVETLDRQLEDLGIGFVDFLKLDTQGSELAILEGAAETLRRSVLGLEVEVNFAPRYERQGFFADVDTLLRGHGFTLFDLELRYGKRREGIFLGGRKGQLTHANALYLRDLTSLRRLSGEASARDERLARVLKAASIALLYGYVDFALEIVTDLEVFTPEERSAARAPLLRARFGASRLPNFRGRGKLARAFALLAERLSPWSRNGVSGSGSLGNP